MDTAWSAWLIAACLPSPSQGMFWGKDSFKCCGSHRKGGDTAEGWIRGASPCCCRMHIPGGSPGWCWGGKGAPALKLGSNLGCDVLLSVSPRLTCWCLAEKCLGHFVDLEKVTVN